MRSLRFSWTKIAEIVGVSRRTLYRRLDEWQLPQHTHYSAISNSDLDSLVSAVRSQNPTSGEVLLMSQLGVRVQRSILRASLHRINPSVIEMRRRHTVRRRVYSVDGPNSLWDLDGHHKLIRWKLVTHGGIDGKTRTIVYLKCSPNNFATTVLQQFQLAVEKFGLPERVRTDKGGEI